MTNQATIADTLEAMELEESTDQVGDQKPGDVLSKPSTENPLPQALAEHTGLRVNLWHTRTGEKINILKWQAESALKKVFRDKDDPEWLGKRIFSQKPTVPLVIGQFLCWLHPKHPDRELNGLDATVVCRSEHIISAQEVSNHVQSKHKRTWAQIQTHRSERNRLEDRQVQREQADAMIRLAERLVANGQPVATQPQPAPPPPAPVTSTPDSVAETVEAGHLHRYMSGEVGSQCKETGCTAVRQVAKQKRKRTK